MEEYKEKKDYRQQALQKFYFNEDGQLVVETNKGKWIDGMQFVKLSGNFSCNTRTMCAIIEKLKGIKVEIEDDGLETLLKKAQSKFQQELNEIEQSWKSNFEKMEQDWKNRYQNELQQNKNLTTAICEFNNMPWYKRMFKKIDIE